MKILISVFFFIALWSTEGYAAPRRQTYDETSTLLKELQDSMDGLRHEVNNHEVELKMFDERLNNEESRLDSLRQHMTESQQAQKELVNGSSSSLDERLLALEGSQKSMTADLRQFKNHANETSTHLAQYQKQIVALEKIIEAQNQNIEHLQTALQSLMEIMQVKSKIVDSAGTYTVKSGDSLDKIAKNNRTTVQAIKELNSLTKDRINVGQVLKLPE